MYNMYVCVYIYIYIYVYVYFFGRFWRLGRDTSTSQNWLQG